MQFKVNISDVPIIIEALNDPDLASKLIRFARDGQIKNKHRFATDQCFMKLSKDEIEQVIDSLSEYFMSIGLRDDGEPNALGLQIESLIDLFSEGVVT